MRQLVAALCALAVCLGSQEKPPFEVTGVAGKEVTVVPEVNGSLTDISWKKGEHIVAELEWFAPSVKGRTKVNKTSGALTFVKLYQNDTGNYKAEALVEGLYQYTFFRLRVLEPPDPPLVNCIDAPNGIQVRCEVDAQYVTRNMNPTYTWEYQKSREQIGGNTSVILIPKSVDPSENITCIIGVYDAEASGSVSLSVCIPKGAAPVKRNRTFLWLLIGFALVAGVAYGCWKRGLLNFKRKDRSRECEGVYGGATAPPENEHFAEECSRDLEGNSGEDVGGGTEAPPEKQHLTEECFGNLEENRGVAVAGGTEAPPENQHLIEGCSGNLEESSGEDVGGGTEAPPEKQHLIKERYANLQENSGEIGGGMEAPPEKQRLNEACTGNLGENSGEGGPELGS